MEHLIGLGVPQRSAHETVGKLVRLALDRGCRLGDLKPDEFRAAHPQLDERVYDRLGPRRAVEAFVSYGSTGPARVDEQVRQWKQRLMMDRPASQGAAS
jgi:argininosuccinate lyase